MLKKICVVLFAATSVPFCQLPANAISHRSLAARQTVARITFGDPTLAPFAHTQFCLRHIFECQTRPITPQLGISFKLMPLAELAFVNKKINDAIIPRRHSNAMLGNEWTLHPEFGDCKDYAATKRHELLSRGWPSSSLLLAHVVTASGEHHLVLVARIREGDFVLDNLDERVLSWLETSYSWVRIQSPENPRNWYSVRSTPRDTTRADYRPVAAP
jgi:predicted transglutaminase-like cysteine proteinase